MLEMMNLGLIEPNVPVPEGNIKKFEAGNGGIVALTYTGNLYGLGTSNFSGTGGKITTWRKLSGGIEDMWVSTRSVLARTTDGRWLFMGTNNYFPTSLGNSVSSFVDVSVYFGPADSKTLKWVAISYNSIAVVFTDGTYGIFGRNSSGGLGLGNTMASRDGLAIRSDFNNVKKIVFDITELDTSFMLLEDGRVFVAGTSLFGQAGTSSGNITTWRLQTEFSNPTVNIFGGNTSFFRLVGQDNGKCTLYAQGRFVEGNLGLQGVTGTGYGNAPQAVFTDADPQANVSVSLNWTRLQTGGNVYYTGTNDGRLQGTGQEEQSIVAGFTVLNPNPAFGGEYTGLKNNNTVAYHLLSGVLYGVGQSALSNNLLPGSGGQRLLVFTQLDTSVVV